MKNEKYSNNISLSIDNKTITDDLTISDHFNNFFTLVAKGVNKISKTPKLFLSYLKNLSKNSFFLLATTEEDVEDILSKLKTNKTAGLAFVPTSFLKYLKKGLLNPVSNFINLSFLKDILPDI